MFKPTMAAIFTSHHFRTALIFSLVFFLKTLAADPVSSFSFADFENDPKFKFNVALYGNATVVNGGSAIRIFGSAVGSRAGRVYEKPIKLVEGKLRQLVSFSTYFAFSMPLKNNHEDGNGLAFVMAFDNSSLSEVSSGLRNGNFPSIVFEVESASVLAKIINTTSSVKMGLKNRERVKLHAWIDYEASSQRLEVRLSEYEYGNSRPSDPLLWHKVDLSNMRKREEMFVGFSTVKKNTSEACFLYSWSFLSRQFPHWMHSEPMDPNAPNKNSENLRVKPKCDCFFRVVAGMVFGGGFGGLIALIAIYLWTRFGVTRPVVPEECVVDFEYKKVNIAVDKGTTEGGNKK